MFLDKITSKQRVRKGRKLGIIRFFSFQIVYPKSV